MCFFFLLKKKDAETAASAVRNLNDYEIGGRQLRVDYATMNDNSRQNNRNNQNRHGHNQHHNQYHNQHNNQQHHNQQPRQQVRRRRNYVLLRKGILMYN
jgi:cleavage stimulation factor subunit 2